MKIHIISVLFFCYVCKSYASDHRDIVTYLRDNNFTVITDDLDIVGLTNKLTNEGPFTVFVPTNKAFADLPEILRTQLHANLPELKHIILSHVVRGGYIGPLISSGTSLTTLSGEDLHFSKVPDGSVSVNGVDLLGSDIVVKNGVIHSIDQVLLPPTQNVMQFLRSNRDILSIAEAMFFLARFDKMLSGDGPFTVFLPVDQAFIDDRNSIQTILANTTYVHELMLNHVISGTIFTTDVSDGYSLTSLGNSSLPVTQTDKGMTINGAELIRPNIQVTNGVVHMVERVILLN